MAGELRVYLGAAPGVGKTYALLDEARRRLGRGARAAIVGVDTHDRPATAELLASLPAVPGEPDVEALLADRPELVAVDDLARPGRLDAVTRLLDAGISVITTLDVGEIESLSDVVGRITGRPATGTVPDAFLREAAVEVVDMTPEALRRRLAHGNVFPAGEVDARLANVFRPENLAALRELALRWVADHAGPLGTGERVAVAITGAPGADNLVRRAGRIAARSHAGLVGIHVRVPAGRRPSTPADVLEGTRRLLADLDGEYREVAGADVAATLVRAARAERATQLVLGATRRSRLHELVAGSVIGDVMRHAGTELDVHVIGTTAGEVPPRARTGVTVPLAGRRRALGWLIFVVGLPVLTVVLTGSNLDLSSALLLYLLLVVAGAATGGIGPAAVGALTAFLLANWYFIPPLHHWEIDNAEDVVALVTFVVVAAVVAGLVVHAARRQAESARARAEARMLADMSGASVGDDPLAVLLVQLRDAFDLTGAAVVRSADGRIEAQVGDLPGPADIVVALGAGHQLLAAGRLLSAEDRGLVAVVADHLTVALQTRQLRVEASTAAALAEANQLRTAILAAVSHDLRTPLASIKASVTSLRQDDVTWPADAVAEFLATIEEETDRLDDLVGNLLDLSRLQTNTLQILERAVGLEEVAPAAVASLGARASSVDLDVPETLPRVRVDPGLLERALANLVSNAVAWSPPGARVRVDASPVGDRVDLRVIDRGPGIPVAARERVFEPFQRLGDRGTDGVGLGLAVARGFVTAMGGEVLVEDTPGGGTTMVVSFPVAEA
ncbi:MAG: kdpD3 [Actinomycetia bacterium]|nr:kdpD3 [Actinomycetes bacterium]